MSLYNVIVIILYRSMIYKIVNLPFVVYIDDIIITGIMWKELRKLKRNDHRDSKLRTWDD